MLSTPSQTTAQHAIFPTFWKNTIWHLLKFSSWVACFLWRMKLWLGFSLQLSEGRHWELGFPFENNHNSQFFPITFWMINDVAHSINSCKAERPTIKLLQLDWVHTSGKSDSYPQQSYHWLCCKLLHPGTVFLLSAYTVPSTTGPSSTTMKATEVLGTTDSLQEGGQVLYSLAYVQPGPQGI